MDNPDHHQQDVQVQPDLSSSASNYRSHGPSQYAPQPQYQYGGPHHAAAGFAIDTEMGSMDSFADSVSEAAHAGNTLRGTEAIERQSMHALAPATAMGGNVSTSLSIGAPSTPGMAPPQPGQGHRSSIGQLPGHHTPYSPTGPRASIDDSGDLGLSGGDPKRKRSKVSRACDECRRKKVRCDAAGDDGTIKTCTNCAKAGVLCGYNRIPMKRGPSKGYIKELSERVQQVESQMAMSNTSGNFRQSMDGNAPSTAYPDQTPYSPEDNVAFKRNFSFSDQQRSPFANVEYSRDRMPSIGWNAVSPHTSGFRGSFSAGDRSRHRASIAIAPDQQAPNPPATSLAKPFWMNNGDGSPRAAKRQKLDPRLEDQCSVFTVDQELLGKYYSEFHANLPILPDADVSIEIVQKASPKIQHAFVAAVNFLPVAKIKLQNGVSGRDSGRTALGETMFSKRDSLEDYMWSKARESPELRSREDNLLLLWTYLLMAVEAENDLNRLRDGSLSKALIIKQAVDLGWSCIMLENKQKQMSELEPDFRDPFKTYWARAWYCAGVLARLHALAVGSGNPMPLQQDTPLPSPATVFSPAQSFLIQSTIALGTVINLVQNAAPLLQFGRQVDTLLRQHALSQLETVFAMAQLDTDGEKQAQHVRLFYDILLSRFTSLGAPFEILQPAVELAEALKQHMIASREKYVYNPLDLHLFTLAVITLLEFTQDGVDTESSKIAAEGLGGIKSALEQVSEMNEIEDQMLDEVRQQQERTEQGSDDIVTTTKAAAAPTTSATVSNIVNTMSSHSMQSSAVKRLHWADALLSLIESRTQENSTDMSKKTNGNGTGNSNVDSNHLDNPPTTSAPAVGGVIAGAGSETGTGTTAPPPTSTPIPAATETNRNEFTVAIDFSRLLKYGYLNVLAESVGV